MAMPVQGSIDTQARIEPHDLTKQEQAVTSSGNTSCSKSVKISDKTVPARPGSHIRSSQEDLAESTKNLGCPPYLRETLRSVQLLDSIDGEAEIFGGFIDGIARLVAARINGCGNALGA